ncbi:gibberellin 2-beta-dioxygenase 6 [Medicago truncatula]|uniref:gibberellin 2beta-dioxygenase n=2 Tax=Medicago truncatula TaxID=3880 RepID=A0A072UXE4_MEDTR|nr:gibberellin 2-beta-dioxygenase 6 [Medicago truncatula]KEH30540.1 gibberellin 2-beta-dioxygenase [Medicago truncatula]
MIDSNPPLLNHYGALLRNSAEPQKAKSSNGQDNTVVECELPLIDLNGLKSCNVSERLACTAAICKAASEWGFFQVINHGINPDLLRNMREEQMKLFRVPFEKKVTCGLLNNPYRWGTPSATSSNHFSWSEAFHIPLTMISEAACWGEFNTLREAINEFAAAMLEVSRLLAGILAENLGHPTDAVEKLCDASTCFLRLNHYPSCPKSKEEIFGLVPHTDSDFLTILYQDQVGGLQLMKDSKWVAVKPNPEALIVNIGDLFQAWSNDEYKSVEHKVVANDKVERYSIAYFLCPSYTTMISGCKEPSTYKNFTFGEYRHQIQEDVKKIGHKVGLSKFLRKDTYTTTMA